MYQANFSQCKWKINLPNYVRAKKYRGENVSFTKQSRFKLLKFVIGDLYSPLGVVTIQTVLNCYSIL